MISDSSLVLNLSWLPISITSIRHSLKLMYLDAAHAVCPQTYAVYDFNTWMERGPQGKNYIQTVTHQIAIPEIVRLNQYNKVPFKELSFSKNNLYQRDNYTCQYCGIRPTREDLTIDHIMPRSRGGKTNWENCVVACRRCNKMKANHLLRDVKLNLLKKPTRPSWNLALTISKSKFKKSWEKFISR